MKGRCALSLRTILLSNFPAMPIHRTIELPTISDAEFEQVDGAVMRCAYAAQNYFGSRFNERIYENDIAARLRSEGFDVQTQVPVTVTHGSFEKTYFLDLLVNRMLYELKAVSDLVAEHDMLVIAPQIRGIVAVRVRLGVVSEESVDRLPQRLATGFRSTKTPFAKRSRRVAKIPKNFS